MSQVSYGTITITDLLDTATYIYYATTPSTIPNDWYKTPMDGAKYMGIYSGPPETGGQPNPATSAILNPNYFTISQFVGNDAEWFYGTILTHLSGTAVPSSSISGATVGSMYLNTDTSNIYKCINITNGSQTWQYAGNLVIGVIENLQIGGRNLLRYTNQSINIEIPANSSIATDSYLMSQYGERWRISSDEGVRYSLSFDYEIQKNSDGGTITPQFYGENCQSQSWDINTNSGHYNTIGTLSTEQIEQLLQIQDSTPYLYRQTFNTIKNSVDNKIIGSNNYCKENLMGGSIVWNQLCNISSADFTGAYSNYCRSVMTLSKPLINGHKYFCSTNINRIIADNNTISILFGGIASNRYVPIKLYNGDVNGTYSTIGTSTNFENNKNVYISNWSGKQNYASGDEVHLSNLQCIDLTVLFGDTIADYLYSLEQTTAGAGVKFFKSMFPKSYYPSSEDSLLNVKTSGKKVIEKNLFNADFIVNTDIVKQEDDSLYIEHNNSILNTHAWDNLSGYNGQITITYKYKYANNGSYAGAFPVIHYTDGTTQNIPVTIVTDFNIVTLTSINGKTVDYVGFTYGTGNNSTTFYLQIEFGSIATTYEPYKEYIYSVSDVDLRGIFKLADNKIYCDGDVYSSDGTITRNTILRAYQSGDELLTDAITDGTNTILYSANAITEKVDAYQYSQIVGSIEEFLDDREVTVPVGHDTKYINKNAGIKFLITNTDSINNEQITISNVQLEIGNKETDWKQAPEDTREKADNAIIDKTLLYYVTGLTTKETNNNDFTSIAYFSNNDSEEAIEELEIDIPQAIQQGNANPPYPETNKKPIIGYNNTDIFISGKNLCGGDLLKNSILESIPSAIEDINNNTISFTAAAEITMPITTPCGLTNKFKDNTQYTFIITYSKNSGLQSNLTVYYTDNSFSSIPSVAATETKTYSVFVSDATKTISYLTKVNSAGTTTIYYNQSGIFEGNLTTVDYLPYIGKNISVDFNTTLYGGKLSLITGKYTKKYEYAEFDGSFDEKWSIVDEGEATQRFVCPLKLQGNLDTTMVNISNQFVYDDNSTDIQNWGKMKIGQDLILYDGYNANIENNHKFITTGERISTDYALEKFIRWLKNNPIQIYYELPADITSNVIYINTIEEITNLLGDNYVRSKVGDIKITYLIEPNIPSLPSQHITDFSGSYNQWTMKKPDYNVDYPYYYTCYEILRGNEQYEWEDLEKDIITDTILDFRKRSNKLNHIMHNITTKTEIQTDKITQTIYADYETIEGIKTLTSTITKQLDEIDYHLSALDTDGREIKSYFEFHAADSDNPEAHIDIKVDKNNSDIGRVYSYIGSQSYQFRDSQNQDAPLFSIDIEGIKGKETRVTDYLGIGANTVNEYQEQWAFRKGTNRSNNGFYHDLQLVWVGGAEPSGSN